MIYSALKELSKSYGVGNVDLVRDDIVDKVNLTDTNELNRIETA